MGSWKNGERENEFVFPEVNQQHTLKQGVGAGKVTGRTSSLQRHGKCIQIQISKLNSQWSILQKESF